MNKKETKEIPGEMYMSLEAMILSVAKILGTPSLFLIRVDVKGIMTIEASATTKAGLGLVIESKKAEKGELNYVG